MVVETMERVDIGQLTAELDRLVAELLTVKEQVERLRPSDDVVEWAERVNRAIGDPVLGSEERTEVVQRVPAPLRHAVAAECYRSSENVTFGWVASIAGVLTFEVPDLLRAFGVHPDETPLTAEEMDEQVALIRQHRHDSTRQ